MQNNYTNAFKLIDDLNDFLIQLAIIPNSRYKGYLWSEVANLSNVKVCFFVFIIYSRPSRT